MSSQSICISAEIRTTFTKGLNRKLRESDKIPAVLYQQAKENIFLTVSRRNLPKAHTGSQVIELDIAGTKKSVLLREVQVNPLSGLPIHLDFQEVNSSQVVSVKVPLEFVGLTKEQEKECSLQMLSRSILFRGKVSDFPPKIQINVSALAPDETLQSDKLAIPQGLAMIGSRKFAVAKLARK